MDIEQRVERLERERCVRSNEDAAEIRDEIRRDLAARTDPFRAQVERDAIVDGLRAQVAELRGAMAAQDQREAKAGERCGVSPIGYGCDWPDALARYLKVGIKRDQRLRDDVGNWQRKAEGFAEERDEANRLLGEMTEALNRTVDQRDAALDSPVPMVLFCPECTERHIDAGEYAEKPHHTHACQSCGFVWRPAVVATVGVRFLPGFRDPEVAMVSSRFGMSTANINAAEPEPS